MTIGAEGNTPKPLCLVIDNSLIVVNEFCQPTRDGPVPFDIMVDDIDAAHVRLKGYGMDVTGISRGRIHDHFEVQTPDRRALTINSSHAGDRAV